MRCDDGAVDGDGTYYVTPFARTSVHVPAEVYTSNERQHTQTCLIRNK